MRRRLGGRRRLLFGWLASDLDRDLRARRLPRDRVVRRPTPQGERSEEEAGFADFELPGRDALLERYPQHRELIESMTRVGRAPAPALSGTRHRHPFDPGA